MRILLHVPKHYESSTELFNAMINLECRPAVRFITCADYPYKRQCKGNVETPYTDYAKHGSKAGKIFAHVRGLLRVAWMLLWWRPHVFHAQELRHAELDWPLLVLSRLLRIPVVWTAHNSLPHERRAYHKPLYRMIYRLANVIIVHTGHTARTLARDFAVPEEKMRVIAHGNMLSLTEDGPERESARAQLKLPADAFVLLFFGRIRPYKGVDLLLDAVAKLDDQHIILIVAGEDQFDSLSGIAASENLRLDLRRVDDATGAKYFRASDLLVLPYRRIDQSGVLMLSMSYGCAVLASDVGGLGEVIQDGKTGFLLPPDDAGLLAERIGAIRDNPERLRAVREAAKAAVHGEYNWANLAQHTIDLYRQIRT